MSSNFVLYLVSERLKRFDKLKVKRLEKERKERQYRNESADDTPSGGMSESIRRSVAKYVFFCFVASLLLIRHYKKHCVLFYH